MDPYNGAAGCVAESCRNVVAVGGEPIALVGPPPVRRPIRPGGVLVLPAVGHGMADYCTALKLPVRGWQGQLLQRRLSSKKAPSNRRRLRWSSGSSKTRVTSCRWGSPMKDDAVIAVGETRAELGGSEYYRSMGDPGCRVATTSGRPIGCRSLWRYPQVDQERLHLIGPRLLQGRPRRDSG